jgi:hypothetical protein
MTPAISPISETKSLLHKYNKSQSYWGVKEHDFGVWGGGKGARGAHRNSKAQFAFFDGGTQTRK